MNRVTHNFPEFFRDLQRHLDGVESERLAGVRRLALNTLGDIQELSPVDTGLYQSSHDLSIGAPSDFEPSPESPPTPEEQRQKARSRLRGIRRLQGLSIFITSNLAYANRLEHGHSKLQAPHGVYGIAAQRAERVAREVLG